MTSRIESQGSRRSHHFFLGIKFFIVLGLVFSILILLNGLKSSFYFPIKTVRIYGAQHLDQQEVQSKLQPLVASSYFNVNVASIRDQLLSFPWVADASVRRVWPAEVTVNIMERKPLAHWNNSALISEAGQIFSPRHVKLSAELPELHGPDGKEVFVLRHYLQMNEMLLPLSQKITKLTLTPYSTWHITLDNGINLQAGHQQVLTRLDRFVKVYSKIVGKRATDVDYVDLRYSNGLAVKWKKPLKT